MDVIWLIDAPSLGETSSKFSDDPSPQGPDIEITVVRMVFAPVAWLLSCFHQNLKGLPLRPRDFLQNSPHRLFPFLDDPVSLSIGGKHITGHQHLHSPNSQTGVFDPGRGVVGMHALASPTVLYEKFAILRQPFCPLLATLQLSDHFFTVFIIEGFIKTKLHCPSA